MPGVGAVLMLRRVRVRTRRVVSAVPVAPRRMACFEVCVRAMARIAGMRKRRVTSQVPMVVATAVVSAVMPVRRRVAAEMI